jgi:hypothetical protein
VTDALAQSIHDRLLRRARQRGEDFNRLLNRYAIERFLYRLSRTPPPNGSASKARFCSNCGSTPSIAHGRCRLSRLGPKNAETLARDLRAAAAWNPRTHAVRSRLHPHREIGKTPAMAACARN